MPRYLGPSAQAGWGRWARDDGTIVDIPTDAIPPPAGPADFVGERGGGHVYAPAVPSADLSAATTPTETMLSPGARGMGVGLDMPSATGMPGGFAPGGTAPGVMGEAAAPQPPTATGPRMQMRGTMGAGAIGRGFGGRAAALTEAADLAAGATGESISEESADEVARAQFKALPPLERAKRMEEQKGEIAGQLEEARGDVIAQGIEDNERMLEEARKAREIADKQAALDVEDFKREMADLRATQMRPRRVIEDMSTGGKIASVLGLIASSVYQVRHGGANMAMEVLNKAIDDDLRAQAIDLENRRGMLGQKFGLLQMNMARWRDKEQAMAASRMEAWQVMKMRLEELTSRAASPMARAEAQGIIARMEIEEARAEQDLRLRRSAEARAWQAQKFQQSMAVTDVLMKMNDRISEQARRAAGVLTPEEIKHQADARRAVAEADESEGRLLVPNLPGDGPGGWWKAPSKDKADMASEAVMNAQKLADLHARVRPMLEEISYLERTGNMGDRAALVESLYAQIKAEAKNVFGTGALDKGSLDLLDALLGSTKAKTSNPRVIIDDYFARSMQGTNRVLERAGYTFQTEEVMVNGKKVKRKIPWAPEPSLIGKQRDTTISPPPPPPPDIYPELRQELDKRFRRRPLEPYVKRATGALPSGDAVTDDMLDAYRSGAGVGEF